jgi:hypothetical protein
MQTGILIRSKKLTILQDSKIGHSKAAQKVKARDGPSHSHKVERELSFALAELVQNTALPPL